MRYAAYVLVLSAMCLGQQQLSRETAGRILSSVTFAKPKVARINTSDSGSCDSGMGSPRSGWNALLEAGWVSLQQETTGGGPFSVAMTTCKLVMTSAAQGHLRQGSFGILDFLEAVVATPGNVTVTGISRTSNTDAVVEFSYQMVLTSEGKVLVEPYQARNARATMRLYDDGWRAVNVDKPNADEFEGPSNMYSDTRFREVQWNAQWMPTGHGKGQPQAAPQAHGSNPVIAGGPAHPALPPLPATGAGLSKYSNAQAFYVVHDHSGLVNTRRTDSGIQWLYCSGVLYVFPDRVTYETITSEDGDRHDFDWQKNDIKEIKKNFWPIQSYEAFHIRSANGKTLNFVSQDVRVTVNRIITAAQH